MTGDSITPFKIQPFINSSWWWFHLNNFFHFHRRKLGEDVSPILTYIFAKGLKYHQLDCLLFLFGRETWSLYTSGFWWLIQVQLPYNISTMQGRFFKIPTICNDTVDGSEIPNNHRWDVQTTNLNRFSRRISDPSTACHLLDRDPYNGLP